MKRFLSLISFVWLLLVHNGTLADKITVAHQNDYFPYSYVDEEGNPAGLFIDWWNLWAAKTGSEVEFVPAGYDKCLRLVESGKADAVAGLILKPDFVERFRFAGSIIKLRTLIVLQKGYEPASLDHFDRPVGVIENEISHDIIRENYPDLPVRDYNSFKDLREVVRNQKIAGFIYEFPIPSGDLESLKLPEGYYEYQSIREEEIRPAVKIGNDTMMELVLEGAGFITDEELQAIKEKYGIIKKVSPFNKYGIPALIFLAAIGIFVFFKLRKKNERSLDDYSPNDWKVIIEKGENDHIEFKSTLRWDIKQGKVNKALEQVIAKSISAFLNTEGGMLFIGVSDDGTILGLEDDYNSMSKKSSDGFLLTLTSVINQYLGKQWHKLINVNIVSINGKDVCIVNVSKGHAPAFLDKKGSEEFYIRTSASSQPLSLRESLQYIQDHWNSN